MSLDEIIAAMYASFSFERGEEPNWALQEQIFAADARLVRVNDNGVFEFDPRSFRADLERMIASGALPSFWEGETARETREFADIAHVLSTYEMRESRGGKFVAKAVKSIQLFKRDGKWWISAMLWRREPASAPPQSSD